MVDDRQLGWPNVLLCSRVSLISSQKNLTHHDFLFKEASEWATHTTIRKKWAGLVIISTVRLNWKMVFIVLFRPFWLSRNLFRRAMTCDNLHKFCANHIQHRILWKRKTYKRSIMFMHKWVLVETGYQHCFSFPWKSGRKNYMEKTKENCYLLTITHL